MAKFCVNCGSELDVNADVCLKCGYQGEIITTSETENEFECPNCGNTDKTLMSVIRRLCGYTSDLALRQTVDNKMKEIHNRKVHFKA